MIAVHAWCTRAKLVVFSGPAPADSGTNMAMTEKTPANLGRDQPHFDLLGLQLQLQLQSDDDREPATLIRPNALHVELRSKEREISMWRRSKLSPAVCREEQCGAKISVSQ